MRHIGSPVKAILAVLLLAWGILCLAYPVRAENSLDVIERSLGLLSSGDLDAARQSLAPILTTESDPTALAASGTLELLSEKPAVAETAFRRALDENPRYLAALWGLSLSLLARGHVFEATALVDRAAVVAPGDPHIKSLQAYAYLLLGRYADAALTGKAALEAGDQSPFLLAVLAQVHYNLGYTQKALEFGQRAAARYDDMNFLLPDQHPVLPLTMMITDTPQALEPVTEAPPLATPINTGLDIALPDLKTDTGTRQPFQIIAPRAGSTLRGLQHVRATYQGNREIRFVVFLVDRVMRGMITGIPYHFAWDADSVGPGVHQLTVRAYDYRGVAVEEDTITVTTRDGVNPPVPVTTTRELELQQRMIALTTPDPAPLSLFLQLGYWYRETGETARSTAAYEKAAALDPDAEGVLDALSALYKGNGMHLLSDSAEFYAGSDTVKKVALTFDDGPNPLYTPNILNALKRYNAHSTFFLVGKMAQQYPDLVRQILAEGHELANHTYTHPNLTKLTQHDIFSEVLRTRTVIKEITGQQTYLFRPPGGDIDPFVKKQLRALDYNIIYWDINAGEYVKNTPAVQASLILNKVHSGSIILLHNGLVDGTLNILDTLLSELTKQGYACVTISELLSTPPAPKTDNGNPPNRPGTSDNSSVQK